MSFADTAPRIKSHIYELWLIRVTINPFVRFSFFIRLLNISSTASLSSGKANAAALNEPVPLPKWSRKLDLWASFLAQITEKTTERVRFKHTIIISKLYKIMQQ